MRGIGWRRKVRGSAKFVGEVVSSDLVLVSFSGGRTSALMSKLALEQYPREQLVFVFANTGQEHPKTLEFVQKVDDYLGLDLVWVEAVVHSRARMGTTHRIVNYDSATRDMSLFKAMSYKFGIPGPGWFHCTRELKERPIHSFITQEFKKKKMKGYKTAIGIRADEIDRMDPKADEKALSTPWFRLVSQKKMYSSSGSSSHST